MDAKLAQLIYNTYCSKCSRCYESGRRSFEVRNGEYKAYFDFNCCNPYYKELIGVDIPMHTIQVVCMNYEEGK